MLSVAAVVVCVLVLDTASGLSQDRKALVRAPATTGAGLGIVKSTDPGVTNAIGINSDTYIRFRPAGKQHSRTDAQIMEIQEKVGGILATESIIPMPEICSRFGLNAAGCRRVRHYLGDSLADLARPINVKHKDDESDGALQFPRDAKHYMLGVATTRDGLRQDHRSNIAKYADSFQYIPSNMSKDNPLIFSAQDEAFLVRYKYPTLVKPMPVPRDAEGQHVLMGFHRDRFMDPVRKLSGMDVPYEDKHDVLIWRGTPTGSGFSKCANNFWNASRMLCVSKYGQNTNGRIDVAFSQGGHLLEALVPSSFDLAQLRVDGAMSQERLLQHKFILLVNGNDVASGTEWVVASNSVPFMTHPITRETWMIQSWLQPWKHFIPVEPDFSDLSAKVDWAIDNPDKAKQIAVEGQHYMQEFQDEQREHEVNAAVLAAYLNRVKVEIVPSANESLGEVGNNCGDRVDQSCCDFFKR